MAASDVNTKYPHLAPGFKHTSFAVAAEVFPVPAREGEYIANIPADWCVGFVPHGGYLTSILLVASTYAFSHDPRYTSLKQPDPIYTSLTFSTRCSIGPVTIIISPVKLGRQYSFIRASLHQGGKQCLEAIITHANLAAEAGVNLPTIPKEPPPSWASCLALDLAKDPTSDFRVASKKLRYRVPANDGSSLAAIVGSSRFGPSVREQWTQLNDGSGLNYNLAALGLLSDMFIPLPENYEESRGNYYPTLALTLDIKRPPPERGWPWLFQRIECGTIMNGRMDIDVTIMDEAGEIVAISRHVAIVVGRERNRQRIDTEEAKL